MRVALAGIMTATVITSSVPVNAVEPVAAKQEETTKDGEAGASADITVKFVDERGNVVFEKKLTFEEGVYNYSVLEEYIQKFIPDYKLETSGDFNAVQGAVIEARVMQKAPEEKTQTVKLNYYDEAAKKQIKEAELEVSISDSAVDMATVARYMPEGYVLNGSDCAIRDGWVYVSVSPEEETQTVKLNYYDEAAKKQVAEVSLKMSISDSAVDMATITRYLPEGYVLSGTNGSDCAIRDGYVYVSVAPQEKTQTVKINYYDEAAKKQVKEATLEVSISDSAVDMATVARYMPEGYVLNGSDCAIRDGYVYASVSPEEETRTVYINYYDESAKKQVAEVPVKISADRSEVEMATLLRCLPEGYDLVDTDLKVRDKFVYASVKEREEETKATTFRVVYRDQATQEVVDSETLTGGRQNDNGDYVFKADVDFNIPEGYQLAVAYPEFVVAAGGSASAEILVNKLEETQTVKINYYDEAAKKQAAEVAVEVSAEETMVNKAILARYMPEGYGFSASNASDCVIRDGYVYVSVSPVEKTQTVKINYYDEAAKKQVAEVSLKMSISDSAVDMATITRYLPEGYVLSGTNGSDCAIRDGYVYVSVSPIEETQTVKINYYDETEEKQVAEVPVQISSDRSELEKATVVRFLPAGYVLKNTDLKIRDGYVYVAVEKETEAPVDPENPEIPLTPLEPSTPVEKPEKPETPNKDDNQKEESNKKEESKKDDKKKAPKISDEANPMAAALPAGVSLAAILALLVKKFK